MGMALRGKRDKVFLMTKVCTHGREGVLAMQMLEQSLQRLQTDHLDLWQVHGVVFENDPELFIRKGGAVFDSNFHSFEQRVLPELVKRNIAPLGMKPINGGGDAVKAGVVSAEESLRYAMSLPVSTTTSGIDSVDVLVQNLSIACGFKPLGEEQMAVLRNRCETLAADGRLELFKTTKKYDADIGREQHHYTPPSVLPA
jgi:uncharacterized protein